MDLNKLLLVIPVCESDRNLAQLRAAKMSSVDCDILLAFDKDLSPEHVEVVHNAYRGLSRSCERFILSDSSPLKHWPYPQNNMFKRVAEHLDKNVVKLDKYAAFYLFEPDIAPLTPDFLSILWKKYVDSHKRYMGYVSPEPIKDSKGKVLWKYMNGAGFYPIDVLKKAPSLGLAQYTPWDVYIGNLILSEVTVANELMAHNFGVSELKGTKNNWSAKQTLHGANGTNILKEITGSLSDLHVVHHGCKDGSIYELLSQKVDSICDTNSPKVEQPVQDTVQHLPGFAPYPLNKVKLDGPSILTKVKDVLFGTKDAINMAAPSIDISPFNTTISIEEAVNIADPIADHNEELDKEEFEALRQKQLQRRKKRLAKNGNSSS